MRGDSAARAKRIKGPVDLALGGRPVALLHEHPRRYSEIEAYRNGGGSLTDADKKDGWTETRLYPESVIQSLSTDLAKAEQRRSVMEAALREMVMAAEGVGMEAKKRRKNALAQGVAALGPEGDNG